MAAWVFALLPLRVFTNAVEASCVTMRPPMGWNGYDSTVGDPGQNDTVTLETAQFVAKNLKDVGYEYIVLDAGWFGGVVPGPHTLDSYGRLIPNTTLHPSSANGAGLRPLADQIHAMGLKFGFWIMGGIPREAVDHKLPILGTNYTADQIADLSDVRHCPWSKDFVYGSKVESDGKLHPGVAAYYDSIAELYVKWNTDLIKMDCVFGPNWNRGHEDIEQFMRSMAKLDHPYLLSLSPGGQQSMTHVAQAVNLSHHYNQPMIARVTQDFWDHWSELFFHFETAAESVSLADGLFYPDLDMLPLGWVAHVGGPHQSYFSLSESRALMSQWVLARAPLMWGGAADAIRANATTLGLIANPEVVEVGRKSCGNRQLFRKGNLTAWAAATPDPQKKYVGFFNLGDDAAQVSLKLTDPRIPGTPFQSGAFYVLRDLWEHTTDELAQDMLAVRLQPRSSMLWLVEERRTVAV